jgi:hypothetical protein
MFPGADKLCVVNFSEDFSPKIWRFQKMAVTLHRFSEAGLPAKPFKEARLGKA